MSIDQTRCPDTNPPLSGGGNYRDIQSVVNRLDNDSFYAILDLPRCLKGVVLSDCGNPRDVSLDILELNIKNITIPAMTVPAIKTHFGSGSRGESSKKLEEYSDETISIKVDGDMINYYTIHKWMNMLVSDDGNISTLTKEDYSTTFTVLLLDQYEQPLGSITYNNVFPTSLGSIGLDSTTAEAIFVDFTFSFDYFNFDFIDPNTK